MTIQLHRNQYYAAHRLVRENTIQRYRYIPEDVIACMRTLRSQHIDILEARRDNRDYLMREGVAQVDILRANVRMTKIMRYV